MEAKKTKNNKRPYNKNRKEAAIALFDIAKIYEKVAYSTVYKNCFFSKSYNCWKYTGKAHNYGFYDKNNKL